MVKFRPPHAHGVHEYRTHTQTHSKKKKTESTYGSSFYTQDSNATLIYTLTQWFSPHGLSPLQE